MRSLSKSWHGPHVNKLRLYIFTPEGFAAPDTEKFLTSEICRLFDCDSQTQQSVPLAICLLQCRSVLSILNQVTRSLRWQLNRSPPQYLIQAVFATSFGDMETWSAVNNPAGPEPQLHGKWLASTKALGGPDQTCVPANLATILRNPCYAVMALQLLLRAHLGLGLFSPRGHRGP